MVQQRDHLRGDLVLIPVPDEFDCEITKLSSEERRWIPYLHMPKGRLYTKNNRLFQPKQPQLTMGQSPAYYGIKLNELETENGKREKTP